jgi:hypothetical protein
LTYFPLIVTPGSAMSPSIVPALPQHDVVASGATGRFTERP